MKNAALEQFDLVLFEMQSRGKKDDASSQQQAE